MFSLQDPNIFNIAIEGVFDDCQDIVKAVSNDLRSRRASDRHRQLDQLGRVVAQVVYYFRATCWRPAVREKVSFCVPSGNFGNVCAGHIARMMGLPIDKLVVATNENDVLDEFFRTGTYRVRKSARRTHVEPVMDISKASNFERFVFDLLGRTPTSWALFRDVDTKGGFDLAGTPGRSHRPVRLCFRPQHAPTAWRRSAT
jgi:threonine synthase